MKVILRIDGQEMVFSEDELTAIIEAHFLKKPKAGKWFKVVPKSIRQEIFDCKREDENQEQVRRIIQEAFYEMQKNPEYTKSFETMFPTKTASGILESQMRENVRLSGWYMANWIEQALEWAQRIQNESWQDVCNNPDTADWFRLVIWKNSYTCLIGGSREKKVYQPATTIGEEHTDKDVVLFSCVPLVVRR